MIFKDDTLFYIVYPFVLLDSICVDAHYSTWSSRCGVLSEGFWAGVHQGVLLVLLPLLCFSTPVAATFTTCSTAVWF